MSLHAVLEKRKNGETIRLRYWHKTTHKTVPKEDHPDFKTIEEAKEFCLRQNAKKEADKHLEKHAKAISAKKFKTHYLRFENELVSYGEWYSESAENSWQSNVCWLKNYVIPYFVGKNPNPNLWHIDYEEFRKWLITTTSTRGKELSYSTRNHIIKSLNSFTAYLGANNKMDLGYAKAKCRPFPRKKTNKRTHKDLLTSEDIKLLASSTELNHEFVYVLLHTGMRFQELRSLQFTGVKQGHANIDENLKKPFLDMGLEIFGYIRLESQMKERDVYRDANGEIDRKPLKGRSEISDENTRIIPITDKKAWEILVRQRRLAVKQFDLHKFGMRTDDYLLFDIPASNIRKDLKKIIKKSPHCCRHTFTTELVKRFRSINYGSDMIREVTGHDSSEFEKYIHMLNERAEDDYKKNFDRF